MSLRILTGCMQLYPAVVYFCYTFLSLKEKFSNYRSLTQTQLQEKDNKVVLSSLKKKYKIVTSLTHPQELIPPPTLCIDRITWNCLLIRLDTS